MHSSEHVPSVQGGVVVVEVVVVVVVVEVVVWGVVVVEVVVVVAAAPQDPPVCIQRKSPPTIHSHCPSQREVSYSIVSADPPADPSTGLVEVLISAVDAVPMGLSIIHTPDFKW